MPHRHKLHPRYTRPNSFIDDNREYFTRAKHFKVGNVLFVNNKYQTIGSIAKSSDKVTILTTLNEEHILNPEASFIIKSKEY